MLIEADSLISAKSGDAASAIISACYTCKLQSEINKESITKRIYTAY